ncbi:cytochrome C [Aliarcobacter butzleri]|uniref:cytochrome C n=1 Tax=Aliarcobacter butzleri TaxID=28197 RepID=UPI00263C4C9F|nr:cytochrome C [Aliarcobacter butzleri]MDN5043811.1 cytochrome C [Aliarcobacter butzleri]
MKLLKLLVASSIALGLSTSLMADATKGQKFYIKLLKEPCGMDGAKFAVKHTQDEWKSIAESGKFEQEVIKLCPNVKAGDIKPNAQKEIIDFLIEYASDSGNVPSC